MNRNNRNDCYAAGIVLYNPDINRLCENIKAISPQVDVIYCIDNDSKNISDIEALVNTYSNCIIIKNQYNLGIAAALNTLVKYADNERVEWLLTLDQDSVVSKNMIQQYLQVIEEEKVGVICPLIYDERRENEKKPECLNTTEEVDFCITSGSFMNVKLILEIGGFDEILFIGLVDNEICHRIKKYGYRIIRCNSVILNHELGGVAFKKCGKFYLELGEIMHNETIKKLSYKRIVNPMRLYYATRNMIYLRRKYKDDYVQAWSTWTLTYNLVSSIIRGRNKLKLLRNIYRGIVEGNRLNRKQNI